MWNESRVLSWPLMFRRQYAQPLDIDSVFETLAEMNTYLTNTLRHVGQIATCQETEGIIYIMNNNRDAWVTVDAGSGSLVFTTTLELNTYLTNEDRIAGGIATCLETEGILYIMNNLRTAWISIDFNSKLNSIEFYSHTGDTSIHYTKNSIDISDINSAHTHSTNEIDGFSLVFTHTGDTSIHYTKDTINITDINSAHTHGITEVNELQTTLNSKTNLSSFNSHIGDTSIHFTKASINISDINSAHTHTISDTLNLQTELNSKLNLTGGELTGNLTAVTYYGDGSQLTGIVAGVDISEYNSHTSDTSIHYTKDSINITDINSAHTHSINDVNELQTNLNSKTDLTLFNSHTGETNPHLTEFSDLILTAHTHIISDVSYLQDNLDTKTNLTIFYTHTGDTSIHYIKSDINISDINSAHTHGISEVIDLQTSLNTKTDLSLFNSHTDQTNPHLTQFSDLTSTGHTTHTISDIIGLQTSLDLKSTKITFDNTPWVSTATTFSLSPLKRYDFGTTGCTTTVIWTLLPMTDITEDCEYWFKLAIGTGGTSHTFSGCTFGINNDPVVADATYEFHIKKTIVFIRRII